MTPKQTRQATMSSVYYVGTTFASQGASSFGTVIEPAPLPPVVSIGTGSTTPTELKPSSPPAACDFPDEHKAWLNTLNGLLSIERTGCCGVGIVNGIQGLTSLPTYSIFAALEAAKRKHNKQALALCDAQKEAADRWTLDKTTEKRLAFELAQQARTNFQYKSSTCGMYLFTFTDGYVDFFKRMKEYIDEQKLGTLIMTERTYNTNSGHYIHGMLWSVEHYSWAKKIKEWFD